MGASSTLIRIAAGVLLCVAAIAYATVSAFGVWDVVGVLADRSVDPYAAVVLLWMGLPWSLLVSLMIGLVEAGFQADATSLAVVVLAVCSFINPALLIAGGLKLLRRPRPPGSA
jgi:hypothetical protein